VSGHTPAQAAFLLDLFRDARRLFHAGRPGTGDPDFIGWFAGILLKNGAMKRGTTAFTFDELDRVMVGLDARKARRLIGALVELRDREEQGLPREKVQTPPPIMKAIWTAARRRGYDAETVETIVHAQSNGETSSTKCLRREEALAVLRAVGGETRVFEMQPPRGGGRPSLKETRKVVV
jgi:hypothetical protein